MAALRSLARVALAAAPAARPLPRALPVSVRHMSGGVSQHRNTPDNTVDTYFDFTEENYERVERILGKYPSTFKQAGVIPLLDLAQRQHGGWLPLAAMDKVAKIVGVAPMRVYEVATFYTMFNREKRGKYFIQLCGTTPCMVCGSEDIKNTIMEALGVEDGGTTKDGMFSLLEVECLGACANAPMVQLNDDYYECLTPETTLELIAACKAGQPPPMGKWGSLPMNGQVSCEGPQGKTSLATMPAPTVRGDLPQGEVDPASVKKHMHY